MNRVNKNIEEEIFQLALESFRKNVLAHLEEEAFQPLQDVKRPDMLLRMVIRGKEVHYHAEIKTTSTQESIQASRPQNHLYLSLQPWL